MPCPPAILRKFGPAVHVGHDPPAETRCQASSIRLRALGSNGRPLRETAPRAARARESARNDKPAEECGDQPEDLLLVRLGREAPVGSHRISFRFFGTRCQLITDGFSLRSPPQPRYPRAHF